MADLPLKIRLRNALNEAGREGASNTDPALDTRTCEGGPTMPVERQYSDSGGSRNPEQSENWQSVGDLARKLVREMADRKAREARDG